jgi:hypothetical protein
MDEKRVCNQLPAQGLIVSAVADEMFFDITQQTANPSSVT